MSATRGNIKSSGDDAMTDGQNTTDNDENTQDTIPLAAEIISLFTEIGQRYQQEDDDEKAWLIKHCANPVLAQILEDTTVLMLHVLDAIGRLEPVNGITISKQFGFPKGSVSKVTRRLVAQKLIRTETLPNNKKEILFRMTPLGEELFQLHQALHEEIEKGVFGFLQRYSSDELRFLIRVLKDGLSTSWVNLKD